MDAKTTNQPAAVIDLNEPRYATKDAARLLDCSTKTVLRLIGSGELSPVIRRAKRGIGAILVPETSIQRYLAARVRRGGEAA